MPNKHEYLLEPTLGKSVVEYDTWTKDDKHSVVTARYWRSAEIHVKCDYIPVIDTFDELNPHAFSEANGIYSFKVLPISLHS